MQTGLAPIYNEDTEILILGSAPSVQSLEKQQYYGNKANRFWQVLFTALQVSDPIDYKKRIQMLLDHHIGLWDVYQTFERKGSMDHHFIHHDLNDFNELLKKSKIKTIIANGKTAYQEIVTHHLFSDLTIYSCLSTSGANNSRAKKRQREWRQALTQTDTTYFGKDNWIKAAAFCLRYQVVFVLEQKIEPHLEFDELANSNASYFVTIAQKEPIATIRYETCNHQMICPDRFCVAKKARNRGVGTALLKAFEQKAITQGYQYSLLSAEKSVVPFYQKNGYKAITEEFLEDGIPCVKMEKIL